MCPMEPPYITSQYQQTPPLRRRNIPNCHEGKYPELPLSGVPSPHKGEKRNKALFRTLFYNHDKNEPHETQQWVGSPALSFTFSPSFLCTPTAQPPQALTHSRSTAGPAAEGTCQRSPFSWCPSISLSLYYTSGNLDAKTELKAKISLPKVPGQTHRESSSSTLPAESVDEPSPCAGCPICRV